MARPNFAFIPTDRAALLNTIKWLRERWSQGTVDQAFDAAEVVREKMALANEAYDDGWLVTAKAPPARALALPKWSMPPPSAPPRKPGRPPRKQRQNKLNQANKAMKLIGMKKDDVIEDRLVSRQIKKNGARSSRTIFNIRKKLLDFDDVNNDQRKVIYSQRDELLDAESVSPSPAAK